MMVIRGVHSFPNLRLLHHHLYPSTIVTSATPSRPSNTKSSQNCSTCGVFVPASRRANPNPNGNRRVFVLLCNNDKNNNSSADLRSSNIVRKFYDGINRRDLASVEGLIALNCVYEDLVFPQPFVGRQAILKFFKQFIDSISTDLQFAIDDISEEDTSAVGVTWHLEWKGKPFPFSKGCSFYRLEAVNGQKQIVYARDCVEPAIKPGDSALVAIRGVTWLLQKFPFLADTL